MRGRHRTTDTEREIKREKGRYIVREGGERERGGRRNREREGERGEEKEREGGREGGGERERGKERGREGGKEGEREGGRRKRVVLEEAGGTDLYRPIKSTVHSVNCCQAV